MLLQMQAAVSLLQVAKAGIVSGKWPSHLMHVSSVQYNLVACTVV
jgi:hypothetical protein